MMSLIQSKTRNKDTNVQKPKKWKAERSVGKGSLHALYLYILGYLHSLDTHLKDNPPFLSITLSLPLQDTVH